MISNSLFTEQNVNTMELELYFDFLSQPSRALYIFLKTCGIPFEPRIVKIVNGDNTTDDYQEIHPFGKVPAINHKGFKLIERYISMDP